MDWRTLSSENDEQEWDADWRRIELLNQTLILGMRHWWAELISKTPQKQDGKLFLVSGVGPSNQNQTQS